MKKYIRTLNDIYAATKEMEIRAFYINSSKGIDHLIFDDKCTRMEFLGEVVSQSDNLEELIDLYIDKETKTIFHKHNGYVINWETNQVYSLKGLIKEFHSVKGAIYTDTGLTYVTKLNDKGDSVLI